MPRLNHLGVRFPPPLLFVLSFVLGRLVQQAWPPVLTLLRVLVLRREERYLTGAFGEAYRAVPAARPAVGLKEGRRLGR